MPPRVRSRAPRFSTVTQAPICATSSDRRLHPLDCHQAAKPRGERRRRRRGAARRRPGKPRGLRTQLTQSPHGGDPYPVFAVAQRRGEVRDGLLRRGTDSSQQLGGHGERPDEGREAVSRWTARPSPALETRLAGRWRPQCEPLDHCRPAGSSAPGMASRAGVPIPPSTSAACRRTSQRGSPSIAVASGTTAFAAEPTWISAMAAASRTTGSGRAAGQPAPGRPSPPSGQSAPRHRQRIAVSPVRRP